MSRRSSIHLWKSCGVPSRMSQDSSFSILRREFKAPSPTLVGKKLLFLSDFHLRVGKTYSLRWFGGNMTWTGTDYVESLLRKSLDLVKPDFFIFGGDLISESAWINEGMRILSEVPCPVRIAIPGNWDKRRRAWIPHYVWENKYSEIGYHFLSNKLLAFDDIAFYGTDDYKVGRPIYHRDFDSLPKNVFRCVISHNPDSIPNAFAPEDFSDIDLILCGHTHAGQIRLPLFGAIKTSSRYWKKFEHGIYTNSNHHTEMIISAGIGGTFIPIRMSCPPEIVWIEFK